MTDVPNAHALVATKLYNMLDRTRDAWNFHKVRTERNKTPIAIFELSREEALTRGYWTGDPGDDVESASDPLYGFDGEATAGETLDEAEETAESENPDDVLVNGDDELAEAEALLEGFDFDAEDDTWGIDIYCQAVILLTSQVEAVSSEHH